MVWLPFVYFPPTLTLFRGILDSYPISGTAMCIMIFMPQCTDCISSFINIYKGTGIWFKFIFEYPIYCLPILKTNWFLAPFCSTCEPLGADCWECGGTLLLSLFNEALLFVVPGSESAWINYAEKPRGPLQHLPPFPKRGMIKLLYNTEFFRSRKTGSGKNHFMWSIISLILHVYDQSSRMSATTNSCLTYWGHLCTPLKYKRILKDNCSHSLWVSLELTQNTVASGDTPLIQDKHNFLISTFCSFTLPGTHAQQKQSGSFCGCINVLWISPLVLLQCQTESTGSLQVTLYMLTT